MFNRRKQREKKHRTGDIPVGAFSDIAFLLIIYFIVATTLVKVRTVTADLPSGEKQADAQIDKTPTVILRGPNIFFSDTKVTIEGLRNRLDMLELPEKEPNKRVVMLESTDDTPYETYFQVLATISASGGVVALVEEEE